MPINEELKYSMKLRSLYYLYEKGLTQTEIAKRLNISRVTLSNYHLQDCPLAPTFLQGLLHSLGAAPPIRSSTSSS